MKTIVAFRTRSESDWYGSDHYSKMEIRNDGTTNAITSVTKDNLILELYEKSRDWMEP